MAKGIKVSSTENTKDQVAKFKAEFAKLNSKTPFKLMVFPGGGTLASHSYHETRDEALTLFFQAPCRALVTFFGPNGPVFIKYKYR